MQGMLFQDVATLSSNGILGSFPIVLASGDPLFVDAANDNFQLAAGSEAIDSAVEVIEEQPNRPQLAEVKNPLGIALSPILAPELDVFGQARIQADDPNSPNPGGQGGSIDRGAIDRVDFAGPFAVLINPQDNDAEGNDTNPQDTYVSIARHAELLQYPACRCRNGA